MPLAAVALLLTTSAPATLPAYAHNDYENDRPLERALELGYRGVEADFFFVDGELLVAHDRHEVEPGRTLEALYLQPLAERVDTLGSVYGDGTPFFLNVEAKEEDPAGYAALRELLTRYSRTLRRVEHGRVHDGPVIVTLVGWHPPPEELRSEAVRYAGIHRHIHEWQESDTMLTPDPLWMLSIEYRRLFRWMGRIPMPRHHRRGLDRIREFRRAHPEMLIRVIRAPRSRQVYESLLDAGVHLIAAKDLEKSARTLRTILDGSE